MSKILESLSKQDAEDNHKAMIRIREWIERA